MELTKTMIYGAGMKPSLMSVGHYVSGPGGAISPTTVGANSILFEMITEGAVYGPEGKSLHGVGSLFAHHCGEQTVSRTEGEGHYACMTALFRFGPGAEDAAWMRCFHWDQRDEVLRFAEEMLFAFHHTDLDRSVLGDLIWSQFRFRLEEFRSRAKGQEIPPRVASVISYMERNYARAIGIEDLAAVVGLSTSHLHAEFRDHLGMTPHQHLIHQRMRAARHRLATSSDPIKSVALDVGYANTENFCRAFRKHCGLTAASYRRKFMPYA